MNATSIEPTAIARPTVDRLRVEQGLWFLMACLPFCNIARLPPTPTVWGEWVALTLFASWLVLRGVLAPSGPRAWPWSSVALLGLAGLMLLQQVLRMTVQPIALLLAAAAVVLAALLTAGVASIDDARRRAGLARAFAWGLLVALGLNAATVLLGLMGHEILLLNIYDAPAMTRAVGLVGQANHLGALAVFGLAAAQLLRSQGRLAPAAHWVVVLVAALVCAASSSRVALVMWLLATLWTTLWLHRRGSKLGGVVGMAVLFAVVQVGWLAKGSIVAAGDTQVVFTRSADAGRLSMLHDAVALWQQHPVLGVGHGNYAASRLHELNGPMPSAHADNAHNLVAHAMAEWGSVGLALVLSLAGLMLWVAWQRLRDRQAGDEELMAATWVLCLLAYSMLEHPLWFMHWLLPLVLLSGLLKQPLMLSRPPAGPARPAAAIAMLAVVLALSAGAAWDYLRIQTLAMRMLADNDRPKGTMSKVSILEVGSVESLTLFPRYARIMLSFKLPLDTDFADEKLAIARQAMDLIPNGEGMARYALFAVMADKEGEARALLEGFAKRNPLQYDHAYERMTTWAGMNPQLVLFVATLPPGRPLPASELPKAR